MSQHSRTNSPYHARQEERRSRLLAERAHGMRHAPTASEAALWQHLRGRQLGVQFRRQVVVGRFIVDFLVPSVRLVVEVDGGWHSGRDAADARRDAVLQRLGYRVLRLAAELVDREVEVAVAWVRDALAVPRGGLPSGLLLRTMLLAEVVLDSGGTILIDDENGVPPPPPENGNPILTGRQGFAPEELVP